MSRITVLPIRIEKHTDHGNVLSESAPRSSSSNHFTQGLPLLFILHQPATPSHHIIHYVENSLESTGGSFRLHEASDGQSNFAPVFKDNKQLDSEAGRLDLQGVLLVDAGSNGVGFARELQIANPMALPFP
jgi:hypothetical protein